MLSTAMFHVAIDTPNGRWLQADFDDEPHMEDWVMRMLAILRVQYGTHDWFKVRIEEFTL